MPTDTVPYGRKTQKPSPVAEVHILWMTAGLGCDGDSVSITAATQPGIEDVLLGAIPGLPKVHLHNPVLAYENGSDFLKFFHMAAKGQLEPFVLVVEGSIPNEKIKKEGYWAAMGTDEVTGQPIPTCDWIDKLAPHALAIVTAGTCAAYGGIHAMEGNPTGCMGLADYLGWDWRSKAGLPIVNVPGCPVQPDNFMETVLYLLCHSTSSIFRGYSIFMKGKDPRDAHFITSRICGICGDNHATCASYAQNMAFGVRPPALGEWIVNLGEAAEYMFDHNIFQDNLVGVDFCEQMVKETNPSVWAKAQKTAAPHSDAHGYKTIADIMTALNPFSGAFYLEALQVSRLTREMFCLMEGRHVHPSTIYPGGVGTVPTVQLFTDYIVRLMKYVEFMKKVVPLHDDLFDFFYEALPGYEEVGRRRILLACWGSFNDPDYCDYTYKNMTEWGRKMFVTPGVVVDGELVTSDLVDINLNIRILLGSSYYDDWQGGQTFVKKDPLGNPVDQRHPWNQTTTPRPQKRDFKDKYTWVMSPRWYDKRTGDYLALDTGGGPIARFWSTALAGLVDIGYVKSTGKSVKIYLPKTATKPEVEFEWKIPKWSNAIERDRARTYFQAYAAAAALHFAEKALAELHAGRTKTWSDFKVPDEAIGCGFHEAVRGVLSHHVVIKNGKIANYHPYPPTPWNANPRDSYGTPGPYEDAVQNTPIFEENGRDKFKGIDIMRAVRSFDPCLPCGVHMYDGSGKILETRHSPMFGSNG